MAIYIRPSGTEIELSDTKEMRAFAKAQGWKKAPKLIEPDPIEGNDNGDNSGPDGESDLTGDSGSGDRS